MYKMMYGPFVTCETLPTKHDTTTLQWMENVDSNGVKVEVAMTQSSPDIESKDILTLEMVKRDLSLYHADVLANYACAGTRNDIVRPGLFNADGIYIGIKRDHWRDVSARPHPDAFLSVHMKQEWLGQRSIFTGKGYTTKRIEPRAAPHQVWVKIAADGTVEHLATNQIPGSTKCNLVWWGVYEEGTMNDMVVAMLPRLLTGTVVEDETIGFIYAHIEPCSKIDHPVFKPRRAPAKAPAKPTKKKEESEEDKAKRIEANKKFLENARQQKSPGATKTSQKVTETRLHTGSDSDSGEESEHVRKIRDREAAESKVRAEEERARREKIAADRKARANASAKPYTVPGVSHKSKDAGDVEAAPGASARAKRAAKKAVDVESIARHVEALKIAEHERVAVEEAKLQLRRVGKAIGGS